MVLYLMVLCIHRRVLLIYLRFKEVLLIAIMQMYHIPIKNYVTFLIYFSVSSRHCYSPWLLLTVIASHRGCHSPSLPSPWLPPTVIARSFSLRSNLPLRWSLELGLFRRRRTPHTVDENNLLLFPDACFCYGNVPRSGVQYIIKHLLIYFGCTHVAF